jgi:hypothetical protein
MSDPLISVLVPAYNREDTLRECVESALNNGYNRLEIIIADNGSTDKTWNVANTLAQSDQRVKLIHHERNLGPLPNWRSCLDAAQGQYVHWLWSDDWIDCGFYRKIVDGMAIRRAQFGMCAARLINTKEGWWQTFSSFADIKRDKNEFLLRMLSGVSVIVSPAAALIATDSCRKHFHDDIPKISGLECNRRAIGCDALMILGGILDAEAVFTCPESLANFRAHPGSISESSGSDLVNAHYAWARIWWSRRNGMPRSVNAVDALRLLKAKCYRAACQCILP